VDHGQQICVVDIDGEEIGAMIETSFPFLVSLFISFPPYIEANLTLYLTAVAVERIFSGGRNTISLRHASLHPDTIRTLMLVKHHLRLSRVQVDNGRALSTSLIV